VTDPAPSSLLLLTPDVPAREAEALLDGAVVSRSDDQVSEVAGPGAVACMQGLLTNDLEGPGEEGFVYGAVLTPKGMIVCDLWAARFSGVVTLTYPSQGRDALLDIFQRSLPPRLAKVTDRTGDRAILRLAGPMAIEVAERAGLAIPPVGRVGRSAFRPSDCLVARPPLGLPFALQLLVAEPDLALVTDALERAGAVTTGPGVLELSRILSGWPRLGAEIETKTLPQEVRYDEINGVSYTKGCYTGQETVARLHFRGHTNRHLVGLTWEETPDPEQAEIAQDDHAVGRVTSVAWLAPVDHYIGLGLVRRETDLARPVTAGGVTARAVELPLKLASPQ
jgi:folate-binding protein YgfZ